MTRWVALAVAGLIVAVAVAYAASRLASPKVGLTSEPVSAGAKLAPPTVHRRHRAPPAPPPTRTVTTPPQTDYGGGEHDD